MTMNHTWLMILAMACITFSCRFFFFNHLLPLQLNPRLRRFLSFTAPAVLTAMWVPIVFVNAETHQFRVLTDPFLIAGLLTLAVSLVMRSATRILVFSLSAFVGLKLLL